MGSSKKQTVGYWYEMGLHLGLCRGPVDALMEIRSGDRTAWQGNVTDNAQIYIDALGLFGGQEREGGLQGDADVMMGGPAQVANDYLAGQQGSPQPAYRGLFGLVYRRGKIAANNPYIKPWAVRVRRILQGWTGGSAWYPEKAQLPIDGLVDTDVSGTIAYTDDWAYRVEAAGSTADYSAADHDYSSWAVGPGGFGNVPSPPTVGTIVTSGAGKAIWLRRTIPKGGKTEITIEVAADDGAWLWWNGVPKMVADLAGGTVVLSGVDLLESNELAVKVMDSVPAGSPGGIFAGVTVSWVGTYSNGAAMNPAHIIYECLTNDDWGLGYPSGKIDDASFQAAADTFHAEGLGLCMTWSRQDSIQNFVQTVVDHAGAACGEDPRTGLFKLKAIRADYDIEDLREFSAAAGNIITLDSFDRASLTETINELTVSYTDAATGKEGSVTVQQLANIQAQGAVVSQSRAYPGLPSIGLAVRTALRDLRATASALARVRMTVTRDAYDLQPGDVIKFVWPELGIAQMALRVGKVDYGSLTNGAIKLECVEDVFGLPASGYIDPQPIGWTEPNTTPQASPAVEAIEAPYRELILEIGRAEAEALPVDAGYMGTVAAQPSGFSLNYQLYTRTGADPYTDVGAGEWCPTGLLQDDIEPLEDAVVLTSAVSLDQVDLGTLGMLGSGADAEMVRVDGVAGSTLTLGRGCLDTVPRAWPAGTRFWAIDEYTVGAVTEYVAGETVDAKPLTRTGTGLLSESDAPTASLTLDQRQARPYPPGKLRITDDLTADAAYPAEAFGELTVTWAHRDRLLQDDQIIDENDASIGPEPGTTYTARFYLDDVLDETETGISGTSTTPVTLSGNGVARVEVEAVRDGLVSWQAATAEFDYLVTPPAPRITDAGDTRITDSGDRRITE